MWCWRWAFASGAGEKFGEPPTWTDKATYIQVDTDPQRVGWHVPAEVGIVGDPKLVLRQIIDAIKAMQLDFSAKRESPWLQQMVEVRQNYERMIAERAAKTHSDVPIHPDRLTKDLISVIDKDATLIIDSFTLSGYTSQWFTAHTTGQIVDAGPLAPVGHGVGMGIGAQLGRPGKQVIIVSGDGGLGIGGMDMETAAKYNLPIICLLWNNSSWGPSFEQMPLLKGRDRSVRYGAQYPLRQGVRADGSAYRARRDPRRDHPRPGAGAQIRQNLTHQRAGR